MCNAYRKQQHTFDKGQTIYLFGCFGIEKLCQDSDKIATFSLEVIQC